MNPQQVFCPNPECSSRGIAGANNIGIKSRKQRRYLCKTCKKSFAETKGTPLFNLKLPHSLFVLVSTLMAHGCPPQAIVAAFGLDERTVFDWQKKAGGHCEQVHQALVEQPRDLVQVQADEIRVKFAKKLVVWMAMAIQVPTRLWLGGVLSAHRDQSLMDRLAAKVKACALPRPLLLATDGLASYVRAWKKVFRTPVRTGKRGRPLLLSWPGVVIGQVIKRHRAKRLVEVEARLVAGTAQEREALSLPEQKLHSSYIERINATFRARNRDSDLGSPAYRAELARVCMVWCGVVEASIVRRLRFRAGCIWSAPSTTSALFMTVCGRSVLRGSANGPSALRRWRRGSPTSCMIMARHRPVSLPARICSMISSTVPS